MTWSWLYFAVAVQIVATLWIPRRERLALKVVLAVVFVVIGEAVLLSPIAREALIVTPVLLTTGLLFLLEIAASRENPLVQVLWMASGIGNLVLMLRWQDELVAWIDSRRSSLAIGCAVAALLLGALAVRGRRRSASA